MELESPAGCNRPFAVQIRVDCGGLDVAYIDADTAHRSAEPPKSAIVGVEMQTQ
jgi:hypothetical protein